MNRQKIIQNFIIPLFLIGLTWILFIQVKDFEYVWDDLILFVNDSSLRSGEWSWSKVSRPVLEGTYYFRPLVFTSFIYEFKYTSAIPYYSHLINLFIFSINTVLVYLFFKIYLGKLKVENFILKSSLGALIYLIHPIQIETFAWVSGRFDLFSTFFCLLAIIFYLLINNNTLRSIFVSLSWLCALFSKESALLLPVIIFLLDLVLAWHKNNFKFNIWLITILKKNFVLIIFLFIFALIYLILRSMALNGMLEGNWTENESFLLRIWLSLYTLGYYFQIAFLPFFSMGGIYPFTINENFNLYGHFRVFITLIIVLFIIYGIYRRKDSGIFLLLGIIGLFLVLQTVTLMMPASSIVCDRFLSFPIVFFILFIISFNNEKYFFIKNSSEFNKKLSKLIMVFWLVITLFTTLSILPMWKSNINLWAWQYEKNPNGFARYPYLSFLISKNYLDLAEDFFNKKGISNLNAYEQIYYAIYLSLKNDQDAIPYFEGAISASPSLDNVKHLSTYQYNALISAYFNLGVSYIKFSDNWGKAKYYFEKIIDSQPSNVDAAYMLSLVYHHEMKYELAKKYYDIARDNVYLGVNSENERKYWESLDRLCKNKKIINYKGCIF